MSVTRGTIECSRAFAAFIPSNKKQRSPKHHENTNRKSYVSVEKSGILAPIMSPLSLAYSHMHKILV